MTASIKLSLLFFANSAFAGDIKQVEAQSIVIKNQVEQAEKMEEELAEILKLIEEKKAAEEATPPLPTPAPPASEE